MQYHLDILCLTYDELVPSLMTEPNYKQSKARKNITVHGRGGNGRQVLIEYETLPQKYKNAVREKYGDPYEYLAKQPILDVIDWDYQAQKFYTEYILPNQMKLPEEYVQRYTKAASWLNGIHRLTSDKRALKRTLNVTIGAFWGIVTEMIATHDVKLPRTERRLKDKVKEYKTGKYACLIENWRFGNDNSRKVKDEVAEAFLLELLSHPHQHDDTIIAIKYNEWAAESGREVITPAAVGYWRRNNAHLITQKREGTSVNYNRYSKQIHRNRPSAPMLLVGSDDNVLDLYFAKYHRPVLYAVMDAYNDYILGYAVGDNVTIELIKQAYRNAQRHVMELTGQPLLWHQIQTDHWGISGKNTTELEAFYNSMAKFTPTALKNARGKYIERAFGDEWHQALKMFPNYSGHNITAKERINPDAIQPNKFPDKSHVHTVVAGFIDMMRKSTNQRTGLSRQEEWLNAINASEKARQIVMNDEMRLQIFGITHPRSNRITTAGLTPTIGGKKIIYDVPAEIIWEHNGKSVNMIYDPEDMSKVLVTDGKGLRFVAPEFKKAPSALADYKEGDRERINNYLDEKKRVMERIGDEIQNRAAILERERIDAESRLQAGVLMKEINHQDQRVITGQLPTQDDPGEDIYSLM